MKSAQQPPATIDEYIALYPPEVAAILVRIRETIQKAAPGATERIAYRMPSFEQNGALVYFGGFKAHIGFFPPVRDPQLKKEAAPYAGEKGNLQFQLDEPIPYPLISKLVKARVRENQERVDAKVAKPKAAKKSATKSSAKSATKPKTATRRQ